MLIDHRNQLSRVHLQNSRFAVIDWKFTGNYGSSSSSTRWSLPSNLPENCALPMNELKQLIVSLLSLGTAPPTDEWRKDIEEVLFHFPSRPKQASAGREREEKKKFFKQFHNCCAWSDTSTPAIPALCAVSDPSPAKHHCWRIKTR